MSEEISDVINRMIGPDPALPDVVVLNRDHIDLEAGWVFTWDAGRDAYVSTATNLVLMSFLVRGGLLGDDPLFMDISPGMRAFARDLDSETRVQVFAFDDAEADRVAERLAKSRGLV